MNDVPAGTLDTDQARVRLVLTRELETISVYEALARQASSPDVRVFFEHLAAEEKEHVAEAMWLLRQLDAGQDADFQKSFSTAHFAGQVPSSGPGAPSPNTTVAHPSPSPHAPTAQSAGTSSPGSAAAAAAIPDGVQGSDLARPSYIPEEFTMPGEPHRTLYALPAPPSPFGGAFTVGPLKRRR